MIDSIGLVKNANRPARVEELLIDRDRAEADGDLGEVLRIDDRLEDAGMASSDRLTCFGCQSRADHAHDAVTGDRITLEQYEDGRRRASGVR